MAKWGILFYLFVMNKSYLSLFPHKSAVGFWYEVDDQAWTWRLKYFFTFIMFMMNFFLERGNSPHRHNHYLSIFFVLIMFSFHKKTIDWFNRRIVFVAFVVVKYHQVVCAITHQFCIRVEKTEQNLWIKKNFFTHNSRILFSLKNKKKINKCILSML